MLDPLNIEAYQRLYEIETSAGKTEKALVALDRAASVKSEDPAFWVRLGKLYATIVFKTEPEPKPEDIKRVNGFFEKAVAYSEDDSACLRPWPITTQRRSKSRKRFRST